MEREAEADERSGEIAEPADPGTRRAVRPGTFQARRLKRELTTVPDADHSATSAEHGK